MSVHCLLVKELKGLFISVYNSKRTLDDSALVHYWRHHEGWGETIALCDGTEGRKSGLYILPCYGGMMLHEVFYEWIVLSVSLTLWLRRQCRRRRRGSAGKKNENEWYRPLLRSGYGRVARILFILTDMVIWVCGLSGWL